MGTTIDSGQFTVENSTLLDLTLTDGTLMVNDSTVGGTSIDGGSVYASGSSFGSLVVGPIAEGFCVLAGCRAGTATFDGGSEDYHLIIDGLYVSTTFAVFDNLRLSVTGLDVGTTDIGNGIEIFNVVGIQLEGSVRYALTHGVYLNGCQDGQVDVKVINPSQVIDNTYDGIHVVNCDNVKITGSVRGAVGGGNNPRYGWRVDAASTGIDICVRVSGAQTGEYQNLAGLETSICPPVSAEDPDDGDILVWDESEGLWRPEAADFGSPGGGGGSPGGCTCGIADLYDVDLTGLGDGDILVWDNDAQMWVVVPYEPGGGSPGSSGFVCSDCDLGDLGNVDTTGAQPGDALVYDGTDWGPMPIGSGGGGGGGEFALLAEVVLVGSQTTIDITGIAQTHKDLKVVARLRSDRASNNSDAAALVFGNASFDTGASSYRWVIHYAAAASLTGADDADASIFVGRIAAANADAGAFGIIEGVIADYTEASRQRLFTYSGGGYWTVGTTLGNASGDDAQQVQGIGVWLNTTDPLTRLRFAPQAGTNFVAGSWVRVYGLG